MFGVLCGRVWRGSGLPKWKLRQCVNRCINSARPNDTAGERIGYISTDGTVHDGESNVLGYISINDGKVSDAEKQTIGFARGVRVDWIACYYFFKFFKK